jgi:hypothetical protein
MYFEWMQRLLGYNYIYLIPLLLCAILSLNYLRLKMVKSQRILSLFLLSTFIAEVFAIAWKWWLHETTFWKFNGSNLWIYNFFLVVRHLFILLFFYQIIGSSNLKKIILNSALPTIGFAVLNYFFIQTPHAANIYTIVLTNTITILLVFAYLYQLLHDHILTRLHRNSIFWICVGMLIYYSGTLPFFLFFNYLIKENLPLALSYLNINTALNTIMYSCFSISFLCNPHQK